MIVFSDSVMFGSRNEGVESVNTISKVSDIDKRQGLRKEWVLTFECFLIVQRVVFESATLSVGLCY